MLLLNLNKIRTAQERFEQVYQPETFAADPDTYRVVAPVALAFDIFKEKDRFRLAGTVKTTLELACGRCLEPFTWPVDESFDLRYHPHATSSEGEQAIEEDDLTTAFYENDTIDLSHLMHEQFLLSMPMKPLCSDACHGLCPICGTNLNRGACECTPVWEDPRLAVLRNLKTKS
jgi:uncharacterized protein